MTFGRVRNSIYSPDVRIQIALDGLKPKSIGKTCAVWRISPPNYYKWLKQILEGVKINMDRNYLTSKHPMMIDFRKALLESHKCKEKQLKKENEELRAHLELIRPVSKGKNYSETEKKEILSKVKTSKFSQREAIRLLNIGQTTFYRWNCESKLPVKKPREVALKKSEQPEIIDAVFEVLHSPPKSHGINRTTWIIPDIKACLQRKGILISLNLIRIILKNAGYRFSLAKKVLTSRDSRYNEKLNRIQKVLRNLKPNEKFFSIDEFGPFSVKKRGGRKLSSPGEIRKIETSQKSKGLITIIGALELSTNQIDYLVGKRPDTDLTISLVEELANKFENCSRIYLSWDSASYHASKKLLNRIDELNSASGKKKIVCVPLPSGTQFLNIIESVFGGMYRAVLANSNFSSRAACLKMIDGYFLDRNKYYLSNPKKAGNKLWSKELTHPVFKASNNCVEPSRWTIDKTRRKNTKLI